MERLSDTAIEIINDLHTERLTYENEYTPLIDAAQRLAAYEDTGLEPDAVNAVKHSLMGKSIAEIKEFEGIPIQRLCELAQAEKDGRLVVLPCRVGDTVYKIMGDKIMEMRAVAIPLLISSSGAHLSITSTNYRGAALSLEPSDFGKTVFLTREEGEAALGDRKEAQE